MLNTENLLLSVVVICSKLTYSPFYNFFYNFFNFLAFILSRQVNYLLKVSMCVLCPPTFKK